MKEQKKKTREETFKKMILLESKKYVEAADEISKKFEKARILDDLLLHITI